MAVTATGAVEAVGALSFTDMCLMEFSLVAVLGSGCPLYFPDVVLVAAVTIVEVVSVENVWLPFPLHRRRR